ncbi:hypothetical protein M758_9G062800 [Ceratodon purpureus]|nr:hypothetical protein M758_9G062800 [Ceratodon purpureus]
MQQSGFCTLWVLLLIPTSPSNQKIKNSSLQPQNPNVTHCNRLPTAHNNPSANFEAG